MIFIPQYNWLSFVSFVFSFLKNVIYQVFVYELKDEFAISKVMFYVVSVEGIEVDEAFLFFIKKIFSIFILFFFILIYYNLLFQIIKLKYLNVKY